MPLELISFILLLLAIAIGYVIGRWQNIGQCNSALESKSVSPQSNYYKGLTYLLKDEPDAAIDTFISVLDVNDDTLEIHLALGSLLRRRGELARAVKVHQNLLARSGLSASQSHVIQLELASDFFRSGLLDRAENLLKELVGCRDIKKLTRNKALERLLQVYQDMGDWPEAIDVADQLTAKKFTGGPDKWRVLQSHFCCELASKAVQKKDWAGARRCVRKAQQYDKYGARAKLLLAEIEMAKLAYPAAISCLLSIANQDSQYISEILVPLRQCYLAMERSSECIDTVTSLYREYPGPYLLSFLCDLLAQANNYQEITRLLHTELSHYSDLSVVAALYDLAGADCKDQAAALVVKSLALSQHYVCSDCGFEGETLHWLCPGCQRWASMSTTH